MAIITNMITPADIIWSDHVNTYTWMAMGAQPRTALRTDNGLMIDIFLGVGTRKRRLIIEVNGSDLYDVKIGHMNRKTFDFITDGEETDIYAESLDATLRKLYDSLK